MPQLDGIEHAISSNEVFHLERLPKRIVIAGGGYIANEFAGIFHKFGSQVTLVNRTDVMLRHYDQQIVDRLIQISLRKGIDFKFNANIDRIEKTRRGRSRFDDRLRRLRGGRSAVRDRPPARTSKGSGWSGRAWSWATRRRSGSTPTIAPRYHAFSRSATSPIASS